jgi:hypothetical protein
MTLLHRLGLRGKPVAVDPHTTSPRALAVRHDFFFVRGHPRSGTNWVGALLNLHPQVNCFGEFHFEDIRNAIDGLQAHPWQITSREPLKKVMDDCFADLVRKSILTLKERKPQAKWIGDRTPRGLRVFLEYAPYFLIVRDGRDVLLSWTFHVLRMRPHVLDVVVPRELREQFNVRHARFQADPEHFTKNPHELLTDEGWVRMVADRWANWIRADRASAARMEASDRGARGRLMQLRYEDLHRDTEAWRARMYEFLGLDPSEALSLSSETKTAPGFEKEDPMSFWRHGQVGDWKKYRNTNFDSWFKASAGDVLIDLGYEKDTNW